MAEPAQKPGKSKQDYGTPWALIRAIEARFGAFDWDLAADASNAKAPKFITAEQDSLLQPWHKLGGLLWLNPPFAHLAPWAQKCRDESCLGARIVMLTPASVGSEWFAEYAHNNCRAVFLRPRITFDGMPPNPKTGKVDPYPKDCMITLWGVQQPGFELWRYDSPPAPKSEGGGV